MGQHRSFQEGEVVWIDIGSYSTNFVFTNDIAIDSSMNFKWFLRQILVRSTGVS